MDRLEEYKTELLRLVRQARGNLDKQKVLAEIIEWLNDRDSSFRRVLIEQNLSTNLSLTESEKENLAHIVDMFREKLASEAADRGQKKPTLEDCIRHTMEAWPMHLSYESIKKIYYQYRNK